MNLKSFKFEINLYLFIAIALIFGLTFCYLSLAGHFGFKTQLNDLGNMSQPLWNSLHGNFMEMSNTGGLPYERMSRFAGHTNFIFLFLIPLYAIWSDPVLLLLIQVFMATFAGLPLFLLGKKLFGQKSYLSLLGPIIFYLNPMLHDAVLYDMHALVLGLPFLLFAIYFLEIKNYKWFWVSAIVLMLCKEDMPLVVATMGIWHGLRTKDWKLSLSIFIIGIGVFVFYMAIVMPYFRQTNPEKLINERYEHLGGSVSNILLTLILKPHLIISDLLDKGIISYLSLILIGFSFLPLLTTISIVSLPSLLINLLSSNLITSQPFGYYYLAPIIAIFSASLLYSLKNSNIKKVWPGSQKQLVWLSIFIAVGFSWYFSPVPFSRVSKLKEFCVHPRISEIKEIKKLIPETASLSVQNNLGPHFINRADIVQFPYRRETSDFVLVDITDPYTIIRDKPRQRNFIHIVQLFPQDYYDAVIAQLDNPNYGVVYAGDGFILFQKGAKTDLNTAGYQTLRQRAEIFFKPYQIFAPVNFYEPNFIKN